MGYRAESISVIWRCRERVENGVEQENSQSSDDTARWFLLYARARSIGECLKNQAGGSIFPPLRDNEVDDRYQID